MKIAYRLLLLLLISAFLFSCSEKKAGVEGKLLDGQGQPISSITVIFKQVQESKGYEQFETKTLANGVFHIDGVMPSSEYIITPVSDNWKTKVTTKITTLSEGQTLVLNNPLVIRYNALKDGTVVDTKTGLQWLILGITDLNSSNILSAAKNIKEGGFTDWRLPTKAELLQLQETPAAPVTQTETVLIQKTCCVWVAEPNSENVEWKFYVDDGNDVWASSKVPPDDRIVAVRNYTPAALPTKTPAALPTKTPAAAPPAAVTPEAAPPPPAAAPRAAAPPAAVAPAPRTAAPSAKLPAKKPILELETPAPAPVMEKKDIPAAKIEDGVLRASRKACLANKGQLPKSRATAAPSVAASAAPSVAASAAPSVAASPAKQSPSAKVKTAAQPDISMGDSVTIQFAMNKSIISPEELVKLKAFYAKIKGEKGIIVIEGNADSDGDAADNFRISGDRALSVKAMLHKLELSKDFDVKIAGLSDTKPIADNTTEAGRKLNRRAYITFIPESPATAASSTKQSPLAKVQIPAIKIEDGVLRASRKACLANKGQPAKSRATVAPEVVAPEVAAPAKQPPSAKSRATAAPEIAAPAKQSPSAKSRATAAPEIAAPAKQSPLAKVQIPEVKSEDGVLRASRKACLAKKEKSQSVK